MKAGRKLIAHYLRRRRERELEISQLEISRRMNLESHMFVSLIERAMCPMPPERVRGFARAYEIEEADFFLWCSVARWIDDEVPYAVILYILNLPADEPEGTVDPPGIASSTGPTGGHRTEREADSFLQRLLRSAKGNAKGAEVRRSRSLLKQVRSLIVLFPLLIRSIHASRNFLSCVFFPMGWKEDGPVFAWSLSDEFPFLRFA